MKKYDSLEDACLECKREKNVTSKYSSFPKSCNVVPDGHSVDMKWTFKEIGLIDHLVLWIQMNVLYFHFLNSSQQ